MPRRVTVTFITALAFFRAGRSEQRSCLRRSFALSVVAFILIVKAAVADELLYRYEGDVLPYDEGAGWLVLNACEGGCSEAVEFGRFVLRWPEFESLAYYHLWIARADEPAPPSLWVEWRFRSNFPLGPNFFRCDGKFTVIFREIVAPVYLYGDALISHSGFHFVRDLELNEFHTFRFESPDRNSFGFFVNGREIWSSVATASSALTYIQFGGDGGCFTDRVPDLTNEWDFIRYGTVSYGEQIVAADPPEGFLDARQHAGLDRFLVVFDEPSYVYIDEITIHVADALTGLPMPELVPTVTKTRRREPPDPFDVEDDPRIVEIVLDRPIPFNAVTRFTLDDGVAVNVVEYTFAPGDADGSGTVDLLDVAYLLNCLGSADTAGLCGVFDWDGNAVVDPLDALDVLTGLDGPMP